MSLPVPICQLCDRNCPKLTVHHLIPRQHTKRKKAAVGPTVEICGPCHKQIHTLFTNKELAHQYCSLEQLQANPSMQKFLHWIRKQDPTRKVRTRRAS